MTTDKKKADDKHGHHPPLSSYGDEETRQHSRAFSIASIMAVYFMYLTSSMLPLLVILFGLATALGWIVIPTSFLTVLLTLIALEFAIPLQNGYKPDAQLKSRIERVFAEGTHHYFPGRSIFLPQNNLSKDKAYILAAWPHGLMGGGGHLGFYEMSPRKIATF